ncbi:MAG: SEC-C domain-containing protein [Lachnospiraceae bacterium]|nr:SEC-C domain-containing protein [Lachnospiraceae bacterium]
MTLCEKKKSNPEKEQQGFSLEDRDLEREQQWKSPVEMRVEIWNDFCGKFTVAKNISRKSPAELLLGMSEKSVKEYARLFGVTGEELKNAATSEEAIWNRMKSHPDYLAYLFEWNQMERLLKFVKMPNMVCTSVPDQNLIDLALRLGLMDLSVETVNRSKLLMLRQTKGMGEILATHTEIEWKKLCEKAQTMEKQCMAILNLYGVISMGAFCKKYREYYERNTEVEEIERCVYLGPRTRGKLNTGQTESGREAICLAKIQAVKFDSNDEIDDWHSLEYRNFTAKERKLAACDCWAMYPAWKDLYDTLYESYDIEESELKRWVYGEYVLALEGSNLKELWERLEAYCCIDTLDMNSYLWQTMLGIYLTTGLVKYKGYSRQEYARRMNIPLAVICGKFSMIDYETGVGSESASRSEEEKTGNTEAEHSSALPEEIKESTDCKKMRRIKWDTHLREFPEETQLAIYQIWTMHVGRQKTAKFSRLWMDSGVENGELEYLLAVSLLEVGEYQLALERPLTELKKAFPDDMTLDSIMQMARDGMLREQKKELKNRKLVESGQKNGGMTTSGQAPASINQVFGKTGISIPGTDGMKISAGVTKNGKEGISAGSVILDGTSVSASGNGRGELAEAYEFGTSVDTTYRRMQPKVGRNAPCPCGSGKKYKKCCGR